VDAFVALADPNRRRMLEMLASGSQSAGEIAEKFAISAPAVSQHLKTLREARLVRVEVRGQQRIYSIAREGFKEVDDWMARHVRFWNQRLDRLEAVLAEAAKSNTKNRKTQRVKSRLLKNRRKP
jgi:DNA-binding transcriptional ArsR family regulator